MERAASVWTLLCLWHAAEIRSYGNLWPADTARSLTVLLQTHLSLRITKSGLLNQWTDTWPQGACTDNAKPWLLPWSPASDVMCKCKNTPGPPGKSYPPLPLAGEHHNPTSVCFLPNSHDFLTIAREPQTAEGGGSPDCRANCGKTSPPTPYRCPRAPPRTPRRCPHRC